MEQSEIKSELQESLQCFIEENAGNHRDDVLDNLFHLVDDFFGQHVKSKLISDYDVDNMVQTAPICSEIIKLAEADSWIADDCGLWEGMTYGVLAAIAFHSLENLCHTYLSDVGHDMDDDYPFGDDNDDDNK